MHSRNSFLPLPPAAAEAFSALSRLPLPRLRHALGCADELRARCVEGRQTARQAASELGLGIGQTFGAIRILRHDHYSPERLACVVMRDWGLDDEDIAEMFGRSVRWARVVRAQADEIRAEEPMPSWAEYPDAGLRPEDPSPEEIAQRCMEVRINGVPGSPRRPGIRHYSRREDLGTFVPTSIA